MLYGPLGRPAAGGAGRWFPVIELFDADGALAPIDLGTLLRPRGRVRFGGRSGVLWAGDVRLGEVPVGSKEFFFVQVLAENLDAYVAYGDLKREVLRRSGGRDERDEASFCHKQKRRVKQCIPAFDALVTTTNKGEGYRLRGFLAR